MPFLDFQMRFSRNNAVKWLLLKGLSLIYSGLIRLWLLAYCLGVKKGKSVARKVVSIGNITVGGTGKTPMVDWFLDLCAREDLQPAVLTRGYGAKHAASIQELNTETARLGNSEIFGDEPWFLFQNHPQFSIYISPERVAAARLACKKSDLILLDDGMQHLKLNRDLNVVLIDATTGIGNGRILPLGPLREPLSGLSRADVVVYTRTNLKSSVHIREVLKLNIPKNAPQFDSEYLPVELHSSKSLSPVGIEELDGKNCLLFSGIGNPAGFAETVERTGGRVIGHLVLDDHQKYDDSTRKKVEGFIQAHLCDLVICTEKDWVKLEGWKDTLPEFHRLKMKLRMTADFTDFITEWLIS